MRKHIILSIQLVLATVLVLLALSAPPVVQSQNNTTETGNSTEFSPTPTETETNAPVDQVRETIDEFQSFGDLQGGFGSEEIFTTVMVGLIGIGFVTILLYGLSDQRYRIIFKFLNSRDMVSYVNHALKVTGFSARLGYFQKAIMIYPEVRMVVSEDLILFELPKIADPRYYAFVVKEDKVTTSVSLERLTNKLQVIKLYLDQEIKP